MLRRGDGVGVHRAVIQRMGGIWWRRLLSGGTGEASRVGLGPRMVIAHGCRNRTGWIVQGIVTRCKEFYRIGRRWQLGAMRRAEAGVLRGHAKAVGPLGVENVRALAHVAGECGRRKMHAKMGVGTSQPSPASPHFEQASHAGQTNLRYARQTASPACGRRWPVRPDEGDRPGTCACKTVGTWHVGCTPKWGQAPRSRRQPVPILSRPHTLGTRWSSWSGERACRERAIEA